MAKIPLTDTRRYLPVDLEAFNAEGERSPDALVAVLRQFAVETNPRYQPGNGQTFCNYFAWDATRAMGCEIPYWCRPDGSVARVAEQGADEQQANEMLAWLEKFGPARGWLELGPKDAQERANLGFPTVVVWRSPPGKHGHIGIVRPGVFGSGGPRCAQAGARCRADASVAECFGMRSPRYFTHD